MGKLAPNQTGRLPGGVPRTPSRRCAVRALNLSSTMAGWLPRAVKLSRGTPFLPPTWSPFLRGGLSALLTKGCGVKIEFNDTQGVATCQSK